MHRLLPLPADEIDMHQPYRYHIEYATKLLGNAGWIGSIMDMESDSLANRSVNFIIGRELATGDVEAITSGMRMLLRNVEEPYTGATGYVCKTES